MNTLQRVAKFADVDQQQCVQFRTSQNVLNNSTLTVVRLTEEYIPLPSDAEKKAACIARYTAKKIPNPTSESATLQQQKFKIWLGQFYTSSLTKWWKIRAGSSLIG